MYLRNWMVGCVLLGIVCALAGGAPQTAPKQLGDAEERVLRAANVPTDSAALLDYLKRRTLTDESRLQIEKLIRELDDDKFSVREKATKALKDLGRPALSFLKRAMQSAPLEVVQRCEKCLKEISAKTAVEPIAEVARLLAFRDVPGAAVVLFAYLPHADDPALEEEILACVGRLTVRGDKVDPLVLAALKDASPEKRAAAVYILGQRGEPSLRELVRPFLVDADPLTRQHAAAGLIGKQLLAQLRDNVAIDLGTLRTANVDADGPALLRYLEQRTLSEESQQRVRKLVDDLGHKVWAKREMATKDLMAEKTAALPLLKAALDDLDPERVTRARQCIKVIRSGAPSTAVPSAVVRLLALAGETPSKAGATFKGDPRGLKPGTAVKALLAYLPFADDEVVEEEVVSALTVLSVREAKVSTALVAALNDLAPARRGAAALVLGKVGTLGQVVALKKLLQDPAPRVRFRAAQGLVAALDKSAVPTLIDLLATAADAWVWQVDEQLNGIAGGLAPAIPASESTADFRKKAAAVWAGWWQANEPKVDLAGANRGETHLGLFTITEIDSFVGQRQFGRVWECGRDGKMRWEVTGLNGPMDGQLLPNGHVLIAEGNLSRVSERDKKGTVAWALQIQVQPVVVQRLPNGNTFIGMYDRVMEVTPANVVVYNVMKGPQHFLYGICRLKNGHVAAVTAQGKILIFDPVANVELKTIDIGQANGQAGISALPNGRFLVTLQAFNRIFEVDMQGNVHWQTTYPGVLRAIRLPNGNVLACSVTTRRVAELDRNGAEVWGVTCNGRPWNLRYR